MKTNKIITALLVFITCITMFAAIPGDFEKDNDVDFSDYRILAKAWSGRSGEPDSNPLYDISEPPDGVIDFLDLAVFSEQWLSMEHHAGENCSMCHSNLKLGGTYNLVMKCNNITQTRTVTYVKSLITVNDTQAPSISPVPDVTILWPPNHKLHPITIQANAFDNGGGKITLSVEVESSEPPEADGDGNTIQDFYIDSVNSETGLIELRLRAERSGKGEGRLYTVTITATDSNGNSSKARVEIKSPHDKTKITASI